MDVKEAVGTAKSYVADLFDDEVITQIGLEEVVLDELSGEWKVTVGFARAWNQTDTTNAPTLIRRLNPRERSYKVVRIKDIDGRVISLTDRLLAESPD